MKTLPLILLVSFCLPTFAKSLANQSERGSPEGREERHLLQAEVKELRSDLKEKIAAAQEKRKSAMEAAKALSGDERKAAIEAAQAEFKETIAAIKAERIAGREKLRGSMSNRDEAAAMVKAKKADEALKENARKNEEVSKDILVAAEDAPIVEPSEPVAQSPAKEKGPAVQPEEKSNNRKSSRVSAQ